MKQVLAPVIENIEILPGITRPDGRTILSVKRILLNCPEITLEAKPGQFVMVRCGRECTLPRPFSIHQVNDKSEMTLYFNVWKDGKGTGWLSQRQKDDIVELLGPLGNSFSIYPESRNLLLVAGGIGIAPLYFLAQEALQRECSVTLLSGTPNQHRYPEHLLPTQMKVVTATEDGSVGRRGMVTDLMPDFIDSADQIFACGPTPMYHDIANKYHPLLKDKSVQVSLEVRMGCGLGVCYGCTVKTKRGLRQVCRDGPIFNLEDILWDDLDYSY